MKMFRLAVLLLIAVSLGVAAFLHNKKLNLDAAALKVARQQRCAIDGRLWSEEYRREEQSAAYEFHLAAWDRPQFHYSEELEGCLVRTRSVDFRDDLVTYEHRRVTDITSNHPVLESSVRLVANTERNGAQPLEEPSDIVLTVGENFSRAEFAARADALMSR